MNADALAAVNPALVQSDVAAVLDAVRAVVEEVPAAPEPDADTDYLGRR